MKIIFKKYIILIVLWSLGNSILYSQLATTLSTATSCIEVCNGSITVAIDQSQLDPETVPPFDIEYENIDNGDAGNFVMNGFEITFPDLCSGEYEIEIILNEDEDEKCIFELVTIVPVNTFIPDYTLTFTDGGEEFKNISLTLNNPIPNETITVTTSRAITGETQCTGFLSGNFPNASCPNLFAGEVYCLDFVRANGCQYEKCFTVPVQSCNSEFNITLESLNDECGNTQNGSIEISLSNVLCGNQHIIAWSSGDIGPVADGLKAGEYCVFIKGTGSCANCDAEACFQVGKAPAECTSEVPCDEILASEVLITTDFIFFNTSTNTCEGGSFNFDASGSSVYPVTISVSQQSGDGCISNSLIQLTQFNSVDNFEVECLSNNSTNCAGEYCFDVQRAGCPVTTFCRTIEYCHGRSRNDRGLACLETGDGGQTGNNSGRENLEEIPPVEIGFDREIQTNSSSLVLAKIFPNPFSTEINIQIESTNSQNVRVVLMDIYGRTVLSERQELTKGINLINLEPSMNLASGIYVLTIIDQHQKKHTQLITRMNN